MRFLSKYDRWRLTRTWLFNCYSNLTILWIGCTLPAWRNETDRFTHKGSWLNIGNILSCYPYMPAPNNGSILLYCNDCIPHLNLILIDFEANITVLTAPWYGNILDHTTRTLPDDLSTIYSSINIWICNSTNTIFELRQCHVICTSIRYMIQERSIDIMIVHTAATIV